MSHAEKSGLPLRECIVLITGRDFEKGQEVMYLQEEWERKHIEYEDSDMVREHAVDR